MEWDCVSEDILHVVKGEQIRVDLFVLLAQGRRNAISYRVQISDIYNPLQTFSELVSFSDT